jgi:hypothetical protein
MRVRTVVLVMLLGLASMSRIASAWESLRQKAEKGDAQSEYYLAQNYMDGTGVPRDREEAARWFAAAAAQGFAPAQFVLGYLYEQGDGVERDYRQAVNYYRAAAERGHTTAQNNLAYMYHYMAKACRRILVRPFSGIAVRLSSAIPSHNATLGLCILPATASTGTTAKRLTGSRPRRNRVWRWPRTIWPSCTPTEEASRSTTSKPRLGPARPPSRGMLKPRAT